MKITSIHAAIGSTLASITMKALLAQKKENVRSLSICLQTAKPERLILSFQSRSAVFLVTLQTALNWYETLTLNIPVYFEKENINTGSMESELFLSILSSMAADESLSISENSKWSIQNRFEIGTFKISYPPYGYDWNGDQMVINPKQKKNHKTDFYLRPLWPRYQCYRAETE